MDPTSELSTSLAEVRNIGKVMACAGSVVGVIFAVRIAEADLVMPMNLRANDQKLLSTHWFSGIRKRVSGAAAKGT
jgi:hypothetical protein